MRRTLFMALAAGLVAIVAACGGGTAATQAPGVPGATTGPVVNPPAGNLCAGMPTFNPQAPFPSFPADEALKAKFPAEIDGNPVTDVNSSYFIQFLCVFGDADAIGRFSQAFGNNATALSIGTGDVEIDGDSVTISAFRLAGGDANQMLQHLPELAQAIGADPAQFANTTTSQTNIGGKTITVLTDEDGDVTYLYPSGDTIWSIDGDTSPDASAKIFATLQ
jgi:hypothetical protein